jgi:hypothetical protein
MPFRTEFALLREGDGVSAGSRGSLRRGEGIRAALSALTTERVEGGHGGSGVLRGGEVTSVAQRGASSPMCAGIPAITARSLITAMDRMCPPQPVHASASNPQTRFRSVARSHVVNPARCTAEMPAVPVRTVPSSPVSSRAATTVLSWRRFGLVDPISQHRVVHPKVARHRGGGGRPHGTGALPPTGTRGCTPASFASWS